MGEQCITSRRQSLRSPFPLPQIPPASEWLTIYPNLDLEVALPLVLQGRVIPQETGEWVEIAVEQRPCTPTAERLSVRVRGYLRRVMGNDYEAVANGVHLFLQLAEGSDLDHAS